MDYCLSTQLLAPFNTPILSPLLLYYFYLSYYYFLIYWFECHYLLSYFLIFILFQFIYFFLPIPSVLAKISLKIKKKKYIPLLSSNYIYNISSSSSSFFTLYPFCFPAFRLLKSLFRPLKDPNISQTPVQRDLKTPFLVIFEDNSWRERSNPRRWNGKVGK